MRRESFKKHSLSPQQHEWVPPPPIQQWSPPPPQQSSLPPPQQSSLPQYVPAMLPKYHPEKPPPERKSHKKLWIILAVALALVVIVSAVALQTGNISPSSQHLTTAPTQKASTPQVAAPASIDENAAVLGGSIFAFDNKFGSNNCCNRNGWDTHTAWIGAYTAEHGSGWYQAVGEQSHERVVGIYINPYGDSTGSLASTTWPGLQAAKQVCNAYLPSDATLQTTYQHTFAGNVDGSVNEYYSSLLARTLPSGDFTDVNGHPEKPGLFFVFFHGYGSTPSQIDYCVLGTDRSLDREGVSS